MQLNIRRTIVCKKIYPSKRTLWNESSAKYSQREFKRRFKNTLTEKSLYEQGVKFFWQFTGLQYRPKPKYVSTVL